MYQNELFTTQVSKETTKIRNFSDALIIAKFAISLRSELVWAAALYMFYRIFYFLEDAKNRLNLPQLDKLFVNEVLYRIQAFQCDLAYYIGEDWMFLPHPPALQNYLEHLNNLEMEHPKLLLAYVYHLYLGLLSGGQILAKKRFILGKFTFTHNSHATYNDRVTDFSGVDIGQLKKDLKQAMNEIAETMTQDEKEAFIEESNQVFLLNNLLINAVCGQTLYFIKLLDKVVRILITAAIILFLLLCLIMYTSYERY